jgi:hypothetical protein
MLVIVQIISSGTIRVVKFLKVIIKGIQVSHRLVEEISTDLVYKFKNQVSWEVSSRDKGM